MPCTPDTAVLFNVLNMGVIDESLPEATDQQRSVSLGISQPRAGKQATGNNGTLSSCRMAASDFTISFDNGTLLCKAGTLTVTVQ